MSLTEGAKGKMGVLWELRRGLTALTRCQMITSRLALEDPKISSRIFSLHSASISDSGAPPPRTRSTATQKRFSCSMVAFTSRRQSVWCKMCKCWTRSDVSVCRVAL